MWHIWLCLGFFLSFAPCSHYLSVFSMPFFGSVDVLKNSRLQCPLKWILAVRSHVSPNHNASVRLWPGGNYHHVGHPQHSRRQLVNPLICLHHMKIHTSQKSIGKKNFPESPSCSLNLNLLGIVSRTKKEELFKVNLGAPSTRKLKDNSTKPKPVKSRQSWVHSG